MPNPLLYLFGSAIFAGQMQQGENAFPINTSFSNSPAIIASSQHYKIDQSVAELAAQTGSEKAPNESARSSQSLGLAYYYGWNEASLVFGTRFNNQQLPSLTTKGKDYQQSLAVSTSIGILPFFAAGLQVEYWRFQPDSAETKTTTRPSLSFTLHDASSEGTLLYEAENRSFNQGQSLSALGRVMLGEQLAVGARAQWQNFARFSQLKDALTLGLLGQWKVSKNSQLEAAWNHTQNFAGSDDQRNQLFSLRVESIFHPLLKLGLRWDVGGVERQDSGDTMNRQLSLDWQSRF